MADASIVLNAQELQVQQDRLAEIEALRDAEVANHPPGDEAAQQARDQYFAEEGQHEPNVEAAALLVYYQMKAGDSGDRKKNKDKHSRDKKDEKITDQ